MLGTVQRPIGDPEPRRPPAEGGTRRLVKTIKILSVVTGLELASAPAVARWRFNNPSLRLRWWMAITYQPATQEDTSGLAAWTAQADNWVRGELSSTRPMRARQLFTGQPLPFDFQPPEGGTSGAFEVRGTVTVPDQSNSGVPLTGDLFLTVVWEPAPGESDMPIPELRHLFDVCWVMVDAQTQVSPLVIG